MISAWALLSLSKTHKQMKKLLLVSILVVAMASCIQNEEPEAIIREQTYLLHRANFLPVFGRAVVRELAPGKLEVSIQLENTQGQGSYPAHLHFGSIAEVGELAYDLTPLDLVTGKSVTVLDQVKLSNGRVLDYNQLLQMNGSIKIHLNEDYFKHFVVAFGNIGKNENYLFDGVTVCTGH